MEYPRWDELNSAYLTTFTAHTTDLVAIREQGKFGGVELYCGQVKPDLGRLWVEAEVVGQSMERLL